MDEPARALKALTDKTHYLLAQYWPEYKALLCKDGVIEVPPHGRLLLGPGVRSGTVTAVPRAGAPRRWSFGFEGELNVALGEALGYLRQESDADLDASP